MLKGCLKGCFSSGSKLGPLSRDPPAEKRPLITPKAPFSGPLDPTRPFLSRERERNILFYSFFPFYSLIFFPFFLLSFFSFFPVLFTNFLLSFFLSLFSFSLLLFFIFFSLSCLSRKELFYYYSLSVLFSYSLFLFSLSLIICLIFIYFALFFPFYLSPVRQKRNI